MVKMEMARGEGERGRGGEGKPKPLGAGGGEGNPETSDQERRIVAARLGIRRFGSCCHSAAMGVLFVWGLRFSWGSFSFFLTPIKPLLPTG